MNSFFEANHFHIKKKNKTTAEGAQTTRSSHSFKLYVYKNSNKNPKIKPTFLLTCEQYKVALVNSIKKKYFSPKAHQ